MSYISFYRKWRPQKFSEIIGQEHVVQTLQNSILKNKISHSYIFCGPRGTGKTSLARIFAKAINCKNGPSTEPCNKCENCISITSGINVDVVEIDAASNRGIDDIRELRDKVKYMPVNLRKKVYIIDEAHQITSAASNAFLKVLEEPPEHVVFIMATTEPHEVIPTIMSRCQRFDFEPIPHEKIKLRISEISKNENINISDSAIDLIAKHADGSLRDADGILEQLSSFGDAKITVDDVVSLLGIIDNELLFELTNIILENNINQAVLFIHRVITSGINLKILTSEYLEHLYNLFVIKNYEKPFDILDINEEIQNRYKNQASLISTTQLNYLIDLFSGLLNELKFTESAKIFFKTTILKAVENNLLVKDDSIRHLKMLTNEIKNIKKEVDNTKHEVENVKNEVEDTKLKINKLVVGQAEDLQTAKDLIIEKNVKKDLNVQIIKSNIEVQTDSKLETKEEPKAEPSIEESKAKPISESKLESKVESKLEPNKLEQKSKPKSEPKLEPMIESGLESKLEKKLKDNWDNLLTQLKKRNISIHAMFIETKGFKIVNNSVVFYLESNKKWHKDHLSKNNNLSLLQELIYSLLGVRLKILFELLKSSQDLNVLNSSTLSPSNISNSNNIGNTSNLDNPNGFEEKDILTYFENKFNIKDTKSN